MGVSLRWRKRKEKGEQVEHYIDIEYPVSSSAILRRVEESLCCGVSPATVL